MARVSPAEAAKIIFLLVEKENAVVSEFQEDTIDGSNASNRMSQQELVLNLVNNKIIQIYPLIYFQELGLVQLMQ